MHSHRRRCHGSKIILTDTNSSPDATPAAEEAMPESPESASQEAGSPIQAGDQAADELPMIELSDVEDPAEDAPERHADEVPETEMETESEAAAPSGFASLGLSEPILRAVAEMGYTAPTPIQSQAIPYVLMGRDVLGCAQTGTGKTAGFTLPMLDILSGSRARARMPRSLILEPTRELALQVAENFLMYGKHLRLNHALIIGGESMSDQKDLLMRGVDVLIATPGRLIDMFERGGMLLTDCRVLVIDEADRMLDMGFIPDVERIVAMLPANRQTLFFSATMAPEIRRLADAFLQNPKEITVSKPASVAVTITQRMTLVAEQDKREALRRLVRSEDVQNALIFCNRKKDVDILFKSLSRHGFSVGSLHGDMAQPVRFATLEKFKAGDIRLLCCSDVAARGIDIGGLSHVFNFDVPIHAEDYVHRIGRTGRAGREGRAFMLATPEDQVAVEAIEKLTGFKIERMQVDGLDPVEWAEGGRSRSRGRKSTGKPAKAAKPAEAAKPIEEKAPKTAPASRSERPARKPRPVMVFPPGTAPPAVEVPIAAAPPPAASTSVAMPAPSPRRDEARREQPRRDEPRREAARREEPRRDEPRRDEPRRGRDDDLGPTVLGFGAETPAFMLIPARRRAPEPALESMEA